MNIAELLRLAGFALGALGGVLVFIEFFQVPSYVEYDDSIQSYSLDLAPSEVREHTWIGQVGGFAVALGFALLFVAELLAP
ncbi:MAG: hypothetical protein ABEJ28_12905 [Salinigranum sp.]